jgi:hypothetical protein
MNLKTQPKKNLRRLLQVAAVQEHRSWFIFWHKTWRENSSFHHSLFLRVHTFNIMSKIGHRNNIWGHTFMLRSPPRRSRPNNKKPSSSRYKQIREKKKKKRSSETRFTAVNNCDLRSRHPHVARASASLQNCVRHRQGLEAARRRKTTDDERTDSFVEHGSCVRSLDELIFQHQNVEYLSSLCMSFKMAEPLELSVNHHFW